MYMTYAHMWYMVHTCGVYASYMYMHRSTCIHVIVVRIGFCTTESCYPLHKRMFQIKQSVNIP